MHSVGDADVLRDDADQWCNWWMAAPVQPSMWQYHGRQGTHGVADGDDVQCRVVARVPLWVNNRVFRATMEISAGRNL